MLVLGSAAKQRQKRQCNFLNEGFQIFRLLHHSAQAGKILPLRRGQVFVEGGDSGLDKLPEKMFPGVFREKGKGPEYLQVTLQSHVVISLKEPSPVKGNMSGKGIQVTTEEGLLPV